MDFLVMIAERKILEAMARGEFDNLPGAGRPLPREEGLDGVPAELRMAYKVLKNAGFVPPEVELRKEILTLQGLVEVVEDDAERRKMRRELQAKQIKLSLLMKRPLHLENALEYRDRVYEKFRG
ncbi:DUF1992 domain-containing protein [Geoalkalibacter halelectricus]|uniref:DUF1992 domain-containing protein n=1 Tax=Geoalkalibacter halelectricus TaxID=2847045 RepID=A0ABY5ZKT3_9BACT|nr:DUF1992 domain-containing protein [Geoalkalibacter halelectricus]MDO3377321.1 DUF1992 domain-containing protein [Geoalkalibacter halelectricus]UWZ79193.1 DUF1992 domain-containing protein [Geoalkalibacter halelectricus]